MQSPNEALALSPHTAPGQSQSWEFSPRPPVCRDEPKENASPSILAGGSLIYSLGKKEMEVL